MISSSIIARMFSSPSSRRLPKTVSLSSCLSRMRASFTPASTFAVSALPYLPPSAITPLTMRPASRVTSRSCAAARQPEQLPQRGFSGSSPK